MRAVAGRFRLLHLTLPGQEPNSAPLSAGPAGFPCLARLLELLEAVLAHYSVDHCVGLGVGLGATALLGLATRRPHLLDGLILLNCSGLSEAGWAEWLTHRRHQLGLRGGRLPESLLDWLVWRQFGGRAEGGAARRYRAQCSQLCPANLGLLYRAWVERGPVR